MPESTLFSSARFSSALFSSTLFSGNAPKFCAVCIRAIARVSSDGLIALKASRNGINAGNKQVCQKFFNFGVWATNKVQLSQFFRGSGPLKICSSNKFAKWINSALGNPAVANGCLNNALSA